MSRGRFLFNLYKKPSRELQDLEKLGTDEFAIQAYWNSLPPEKQAALLKETLQLAVSLPFIQKELEMAAFSAS